MINLDYGYIKTDDYIRGKKEKVWFKKDNQKFLYKYGFINYEIYAELIAEQLGKQCGISMASYRIAKYKDTVGVLTPSFLKPGDLILSSDKLRKAVQSIYEENNLPGDLKENTIKNLVETAFTYDSGIKTDLLYKELVKRWMFYGLIMESDKNGTNISFIRKVSFNRTRGRLVLSPDYDNSTMSRLNEDIGNLVSRIRTSEDIYRETDFIKQSFKPDNDDSDIFLDSFRTFVNKRFDIAEEIVAGFKCIDVDKAIKRVQQINKVEVPWEVKFFVQKAVTTRLQDMNLILKNVKNKNK